MLQNVPSADSALERRTAQTEAFWKNCSPGHQRFRKAFENKIYIRPQKWLKIVKVLAMVRLRKRDIFRRKRFIENSIKEKKSDIS